MSNTFMLLARTWPLVTLDNGLTLQAWNPRKSSYTRS